VVAHFVTPAKAGVHGKTTERRLLGSRFRGNDEEKRSRSQLIGSCSSPRLIRLAAGLLLALGVGAGSVAAQCRADRPAELPVTRLGNVPLVDVRVNGAPAVFLADTGAERTILSTAAAQRLGIAAHYEYARRMRSLGAAVSSGDARLRSLGLGSATLADFRVLVGSVSLPSAGGRPLDGLLGADFLGSFEVEIDLPHDRLILYQKPPCAISAPSWHAPYVTIAANRSLHDRLFFPVSLDGHRLAALIDTGAQLTALDAEAATAAGVTGAALARDPSANLRGAAAETVKSRAHRFNRLDIGGEVVRDPVIVVATLGLQDADLVLGADFLRTRRAWLSYGSRRVFLTRP
jgi:predicted aspartyl protease